MRSLLANNLLIIGGCASHANLIEELEDHLINKLPIFDSNIDRVDNVNFVEQKGISPTDLSWSGVAIIAKLDSIRDLWISRD